MTIGMDIRQENTAQVFEYGGEKVCKLFYQAIPYEYVQQEYKNARKLFEWGICVPEAFEIVSRNGRHGIVAIIKGGNQGRISGDFIKEIWGLPD